jgi:hypothetical protein
MNKRGANVNRAQLKQNARCLHDFQREKLHASFDACTTADRKSRVKKALKMTVKRERTKCDSLDAPPPFAYTGSATVNAAAVDGGLALTYEIFGGPPVLDANLVTRSDDKETARCQREMLKRANKLENTVLKEIVKVKKKALRDEAVDSASALEAKLWDVFSDNKKINKAQKRLVKGVNGQCTDLQDSPDTIFPGYDCGNPTPNLGDVELCVIAAARCEACLKINAFDALNLDCDQADDQDANGSCRAAGRKVGPSGQQLTNSDCFPPRVPGSASQTAKICIALANAAPDMPFTPADYQGMPEDCKALVNPICR